MESSTSRLRACPKRGLTLSGEGSKPQFNPDGSFTYTNMLGTEVTYAASNISPELVAEIRTQLELDKQFRSKKGELNASELQGPTELKQRLRKQFLDSAKAAAPRQFALKDSMVAATGHFELFDTLGSVQTSHGIAHRRTNIPG